MASVPGIRSSFRVRESGNLAGPRLLFAHGLGCDQIMWRHVAPLFEDRYRVIRFDHVGHGGADPSRFDPRRHATLEGYADDLLEIVAALQTEPVYYVGHSVSALIGLIAAHREPRAFAGLALIAASPRYLHDEGYEGAFTDEEAATVVAAIDEDWAAWSGQMAPAILGDEYHRDLAAQLTFSFCRTDQDIIGTFARATFYADVRALLPDIAQPCLVLQCAKDAMAPVHVGRYLADHLPHAEFAVVDASGHMPHVTVPRETREHLARWLARHVPDGAPGR